MKLNKRTVALLVSLAVLLTLTLGATLAYIIAQTQSIQNTFTPSNVACTVSNSGNQYAVNNIGDCPAYIRVAIVATWTKTVDGNTVVSAQKPNCEIEFILPDGEENFADYWIEVDGVYYFRRAVPVGSSTEAFTVSATDALDGYTLSIEVVASAIQATKDAVTDWSNAVTVGSDGNLTTINNP